MPNPVISVIIPAINEADQLPALLSYLNQLPHNDLLHEIIVADGGSDDATLEIAAQAGAKTISGKKGRAVQMNAGARVATGSVLYFLHADTYPPANIWYLINEALQNKTDAGCLRLRFQSTSRFLQLNAWFTRFNINAIRFGDQSLFIKREVFETIGGFSNDHIILEDQDIIIRIRKRYRFAVLPYAVTTSDRKYQENGNLRLQLIFLRICIMYRLHYSQQEMLTTYRRLIKKGKL